MPKFTIEKTCSKSPQDAFAVIQKFFDTDPDLRRMDPNYKCQFDSSNLTGTAKGSKFEAELKVSGASAQSTIELSVSLPLMLTPFKGMVESTLQKKLDQVLG